MELSVQVKLDIRQVLSYLTVKGFVLSLCFVAWQVIAPSCLLGWIAADQNMHNESVSEDGTSRGTSKPCVGSVK